MGVGFYCSISHSRPEVPLNWRLSAFSVSKGGKGESVALVLGHVGTR